MNKKISMFIASLTLLTSLSSFAENSCAYQVVLNKRTHTFSYKGATLLLKSPQDTQFFTIRSFTDSAQMGYHKACQQMFQFLTSDEGRSLTRGCQRIQYECNYEAIMKATESYYAN